MKTTRARALLFILFAAAFPACEVSFSTARIADVKLSKDVNDKSEAVNPTSDFNDSDPVIHCVVQLANAPDGTKVRARWVGVKAEGLKENEQLAETDIEAGSSKNIVDFTLKPSASGLPPGNYKVDIYLNPKTGKENQPDKSLGFNVKSSGPSITRAVLSTSPDGDPATTDFSSGTEKVYCLADLSKGVEGTRMAIGWVMVDVEGERPNNEFARSEPLVLKATENQYTSSFKPRNGLLPGRYRVDLYLNDMEKPARSLPFTVTSE